MISEFELEGMFEMIQPDILFIYEGENKERTCELPKT